MAVPRARLLQTAKDFLDAYNEWSVKSVMSIRAPTCIHHTLPRSLASPSRNNDEFSAFLAPVISSFRNFHLAVVDEQDTIVDETRRKVSLHLRGTADTDVGLYANEYIFTLRVTEDGTMVDEIVEFLDSEYTAGFVRKLTDETKKQ